MARKSKGLLEPGVLKIFIPQRIFGLIFTTLAFYIGYYHGDFILPTTKGNEILHLSARLAYALCSSLPMLLSLYAGIEVVSIKTWSNRSCQPTSWKRELGSSAQKLPFKHS